MTNTTRNVTFERGHDCIKFECIHGSERCEPESGGSHGLSGMRIRFVVKGEKGAVQFLLSTGWTPRFCEESEIGSRDIEDWGGKHTYPMELGYHSKTPRYEEQEQANESCEFCDGVPCYCDSSVLNACDAMYTLVNGGDEALWKFLEGYYECTFHDGKYPKVTEYKMPLRKHRQTVASTEPAVKSGWSLTITPTKGDDDDQ